MSRAKPPGRIRPATGADLDTIVELERVCMGEDAWSSSLLAAALGDIWVLDDVTGYAIVRVVADVADLDRIAVDPSCRGRGLGRGLTGAIIDQAAARGAKEIMLEVAHDNAAAMRLYARCGFIEIARRANYYHGDVDAIVMRLAVDAERASVEI